MRKCGVYFLLKRREVVYIGQTHNFPIRFNATNSEFDFDRIRFIECSPFRRTEYEKRLIRIFNPVYNRAHTVKFSRPPNPGAGRRKGCKYDSLKRGQMIAFDREYNPGGTIRYFNKTRVTKKIAYVWVKNEVFIKRIK